jgi:hypothetical protein
VNEFTSCLQSHGWGCSTPRDSGLKPYQAGIKQRHRPHSARVCAVPAWTMSKAGTRDRVRVRLVRAYLVNAFLEEIAFRTR